MSDNDAVIFVIDDDASLRKSLSFLLRSTGYRVDTFALAEIPEVEWCAL